MVIQIGHDQNGSEPRGYQQAGQNHDDAQKNALETIQLQAKSRHANRLIVRC